MRTAFYILFFLVTVFTLRSQEIERKIVIEKGRFYYTTIDPEQQMGTLYTGNISASLKTAKRLALPAGRNYNDPVNPFCWDVLNETVYAVNSLKHPMNDQNESLKRFPLASLQDWSDKVTITEMLNKSIDYNTFTPNIPYAFVTKKSKVLDHFFYDAIALDDTTFCMGLTNNNEFSFWTFNGTGWNHLEMTNFPVSGYFSLFNVKQDVYMILDNGKIYSVSAKKVIPLTEKILNTELSKGFLIINKDDGSVKFLKNDQLNDHTALNELIKKKAIAIF